MLNTDYSIQAQDFTLDVFDKSILANATFSFTSTDQILLTGTSGCGKTSLAKALAGKLYATGDLSFSFIDSVLPKQVKLIPQFFSFKDKSGLSQFYYQQRFNSYDSEQTESVNDLLTRELNQVQLELAQNLAAKFHFSTKLDSALIQLSSGERKKLQLILALSKPCALMILDNPYIGLDKESVVALNDYMTKLVNNQVQFIIIADFNERPEFITTIATISNDRKLTCFTPNEYAAINPEFSTPTVMPIYTNLTLASYTGKIYTRLVSLVNVSISYADKVILNQVNWEVKSGEKWLLRGHNGAGKSTLLSLINGDNPQAYANEIYLFDRRRGSGESIWEIKHNIGFVSPELHWNFDGNTTCLDTVLSGYFDTPGLYHKVNQEQRELAELWLLQLGLSDLKLQRFSQVACGAQRMVLLLRALIKNPTLFVLDEPCQGLDEYQAQIFINLVDQLFSDSTHTIIYVSHRNDQIPHCINRELILAEGRVISNSI